jgi:uncharacterized membrane protein YfcA
MIEAGLLAFTVAGLVVGFAVGVTGVGGGSLMTPILILLFGFSPSAAVGTDLLYAAGTKSFGVWLHGRQRTVNWRLVSLLAMGSLPAALLTIAVLHSIGIDERVERIMVVTLSAAVVATALLTLFRQRLLSLGRREDRALLRKVHNRLRVPATLVGAALLGVLVTLSSVGAGVLGTTLLFLLYPRLPAVKIVGSDIAYAVPLTLVAGIGHMSLGTTDFQVLFYLLLGSLPGIFIGTRLGFRLPDRILRPTIACLLVLVGGSLLFDNVASAFN